MKYQKDYGTLPEPCIKNQDGTYVAQMFNGGKDSGQLEPEEAEKALSLFTAAPELLEACNAAIKSILGSLEEDPEKDWKDSLVDALDCLNGAANKAEGK